MDGANEKARTREGLVRAGASQSEEAARHANFEKHSAEPRPIRKPSLQPLLDAGLDLIPLHRWDARDARGRDRGKTPRDGAWQARQYDSEAVAAAAERDGTNVGVRLPASVVVLDVDPRNGGEEGLLALQLDTGLALDGVPHTATGSGGSHYWFSKPIDLQLLDSLEAYPGVEFKSLGRQVVAAGSVHPNGKHYQWTGEVDLRDLPELPDAVLRLAKRAVASHGEGSGFGELTVEQASEALESIDPTDFRDHEAWLQLMMACHHATAGAARQEFIDWSTGDPTYADHDWIIGRRWDSLHTESSRGGRPITARTFYKLVHDHGGEVPNAEPADDFDLVDDALPTDRRLTLRQMCVAEGKKLPEANFPNCLRLLRHVGGELGLAFDEFQQAAQLTAPQLPWSVDVGRRVTDDVVRRIRQYLVELTGMSWSKEDVTEAVLTLVRESPFHPVRDYLDGLRWDGVPRVDAFLVRYAGAADNAYVRAVGAKALLAAVRRVRRPGCKFDNVVVLEGTQGSGKSSLVKALVPNDEWFSDAPIGNTESKDAPLSLQGKWIIELGEMSVLSKSGVESLKAFVSCSIDHVRRPYARMHEELRRQCIFIGTTNQDAYLKDQTGNRRFWPVRVGTIDLDALTADREQLWAEAAAREASGESLLLPTELWALAAEEQEERVTADPWADKLREWLDGSGGAADGPTEAIDRVHSNTLLTSALGIPVARQTVAEAQRLKVVMTKMLGWKYKQNVKVDRQQGRGYQRE